MSHLACRALLQRRMNISLDLSGLRIILIQCVLLWLHAAHTQPSSRPDITGIHNTWGAVSCFSSRTADMCTPPPPHTHTHHEASPYLMNPNPYPSLCWVCTYCSQVHWVGKWASNTHQMTNSSQKPPTALIVISGEQHEQLLDSDCGDIKRDIILTSLPPKGSIFFLIQVWWNEVDQMMQWGFQVM